MVFMANSFSYSYPSEESALKQSEGRALVGEEGSFEQFEWAALVGEEQGSFEQSEWAALVGEEGGKTGEWGVKTTMGQQLKVHDDSSALLLLRNVPDGIIRGDIEAFFGIPMSGFINRDNNNEPEIVFDTWNKTATVSFINAGYAYTAMQHHKIIELRGEIVDVEGPIMSATCRGGPRSLPKWEPAGEPARRITNISAEQQDPDANQNAPSSGGPIGPPPGRGVPSHGPPAAPQDHFAGWGNEHQQQDGSSQLWLNSTLGDGRGQQQEQEQNSWPGGSAAPSAPSQPDSWTSNSNYIDWDWVQMLAGGTLSSAQPNWGKVGHDGKASEAKSGGIDWNDI